MPYTFKKHTQVQRNIAELDRLRKLYCPDDINLWVQLLTGNNTEEVMKYTSGDHALARGICDYVRTLRYYINKQRTILLTGMIVDPRRRRSGREGQNPVHPYKPLQVGAKKVADYAESLLDRTLFRSCYWHVTTTICEGARSKDVGVECGTKNYSRPSHFITLAPTWGRAVRDRGIDVVKDGKNLFFVLTAKPVEYVWNEDPCITFYECSGFTCKNQEVVMKDRFYVARYNPNGTGEFDFKGFSSGEQPITAMSTLASKANQLLTRRVRKGVMDALAI